MRAAFLFPFASRLSPARSPLTTLTHLIAATGLRPPEVKWRSYRLFGNGCLVSSAFPQLAEAPLIGALLTDVGIRGNIRRNGALSIFALSCPVFPRLLA